MTDDRDPLLINDETRKASLEGRLRTVTAVDDLNGVRIITARDIEEVFDEGVPMDYPHRFEVETPADGLVDIVCPQCRMTIPDVSAQIIAVQSKEGEKPGKIRLKLRAEAHSHVCGQASLRDASPEPPEVEGQEPAFPDDVSDDDLLPA